MKWCFITLPEKKNMEIIYLYLYATIFRMRMGLEYIGFN